MNPFEMVVTIVFLVVAGRVLTGRRSGGKIRNFAGDNNISPDAELLKLRSELEGLARRVQTLERLATDPVTRLADDIERLRDART